MAAFDLSSLPEKEWNRNCNWQAGWATPCRRLCCWAVDCADIRCAGCLRSIVRPLPPRDRFVCLECDVGKADGEGQHSSVDLCEACFRDAAVCHVGADDGGGARAHHAAWLRVDGATGAHEAPVPRDAARAAVVGVVGPSDLSRQPFDAGEECPICYCVTFSDAEPKVAPPGCAVAAHGWCADCVLQALDVAGRRHYFAAPGRALPPAEYFCSPCREHARRDREARAIVDELRAVVASASGRADAVASARAALLASPSLEHRELAVAPAARAAADALALSASAAPTDEVGASSDVTALVAAWAVAELKAVHAGPRNRHLHEALDAAVLDSY